MKKFYHLNHIIFQFNKNLFVCSIDNSEHTSLLSAQLWIDNKVSNEEKKENNTRQQYSEAGKKI